MFMLRIRFDTFCTVPVIASSAPMRRAKRISQPPQACRLLACASRAIGVISTSENRPVPSTTLFWRRGCPEIIPILKTKKFQDFELQTCEMVAPIHPAGVFTHERYGAPSPRGAPPGAPPGGGRGSDSLYFPASSPAGLYAA